MSTETRIETERAHNSIGRLASLAQPVALQALVLGPALLNSHDGHDYRQLRDKLKTAPTFRIAAEGDPPKPQLLRSSSRGPEPA